LWYYVYYFLCVSFICVCVCVCVCVYGPRCLMQINEWMNELLTSTAEMIMRLRGLPFICSLSILTAIFSLNLDYSVILELRMMEVVKNEAVKTCKAPVKSSPPTNPTPDFLQAGCPSCHPTDSAKAQNEKISHSTDSYTWIRRGIFSPNLKFLRPSGGSCNHRIFHPVVTTTIRLRFSAYIYIFIHHQMIATHTIKNRK